ncbi:alpha/beta hydrolase [Cellvibrio japonicus]|uniref:Serine aminopeptidase S33 domain-containing protein n=1 Tax=Cellvibrio japonicus (strain Ueda107) TaxID=498211 RepID=B3PBM3_CELJU|nr:alpha/beta fold hydrolase [Cellvibrio japonicus]ACE82686.1 conserved hypothetical protein [Cellvibrio japonicus Ueda107]QEI13136.1 hypothetical protein FY117_13490 [Cellvibrio japonicus]QEI16710.1 hypothetical protein FY116_13495 [Cellvibrio japonicus]QEI20288.1 hypothetical protein FY115_13490 [Cellvibrio japonicus]
MTQWGLSEKERAFFIGGTVGPIEAILHRGAEAGCAAGKGWVAVICHPNPSQGGTMDNKVVTTLMRTYRDLGIDTLRFNFRGVGKSQGSFDKGRGELADLQAVLAWIGTGYPQSRLLLAGFSFGSAMAAQASHEARGLAHLLLVAPPVERYAYDRGGRFPCPVSVVIGGRDELVDAKGVHTWAAQLSPPAQLLAYPEAGHFFHGLLTTLKADLNEHLIHVLEREKA